MADSNPTVDSEYKSESNVRTQVIRGQSYFLDHAVAAPLAPDTPHLIRGSRMQDLSYPRSRREASARGQRGLLESRLARLRFSLIHHEK